MDVLVRLLLSVLAVPVVFISLMLWPGGKPRGVNPPLGYIFIISAWVVPILAIAQLIVPALTPWYLWSLVPVGAFVLFVVALGLAAWAHRKQQRSLETRRRRKA